jgi:hypothetical protein
MYEIDKLLFLSIPKYTIQKPKRKISTTIVADKISMALLGMVNTNTTEGGYNSLERLQLMMFPVKKS